MRFISICLIIFLIASCSSGRNRLEEEIAYTRAVINQSTDAYQICTEDNIDNLSRCNSLIKLIDEDKRRLAILESKR